MIPGMTKKMDYENKSDAQLVAEWLNITVEELIDMDIDLSTDDLICAGVIKVSEDQEDDG